MEQRLEDHCCRWGLKGVFEDLKCGCFLAVNVVVVPPGAGPGHSGDGKQFVLEWSAEQIALANGHGPEGISVISAIEGHDLMAWLASVCPPLAGDLDRHLHGRRSVIREKQPLEAGDSTESNRQLLGGFMGEIRKDHLLEPSCLIGDRLSHHWIGMAMQGHPPATNRVN